MATSDWPAARWLMGACLAGLALLGGTAWAQPAAGLVEAVRGVAVARFPGEPPRTLAQGAPVREGDQIDVAPASSAVLRLHDGTRLSLRADSRMVVRAWRFQEGGSDSAMTLDLLRGGLRAVTGAITRASPDAARIQTPVAVVGIRGTDLTAVLCDAPGRCAPSRRDRDGDRASADRDEPIAASARVIQVQGQAESVDAADRRRRLLVGSSLYPGDRLLTAAGAMVVLGFRDNSRVTLAASSELRIDDFRFDARAPQEGRMGLAVVRGALRTLTGMIASANPRNFSMTTPTATLGVRGTGFDLACVGACAEGGEGAAAEDLLRVCTWRGEIELLPPGQERPEPVPLDQCAQVARGEVRPLPEGLRLDVPRPDGIEFPDTLFSQVLLPDEPEGLLVRVAFGFVRVSVGGDFRDLGNGEGAWSDGRTVERVRGMSELFTGPNKMCRR